MTQENETSSGISIFDLCRNFHEAYGKAFTIGNIIKGFETTGAWPYCSEKHLSRPLHKSVHDLQPIVSEAGLAEMVKEKGRRLRSGQGSQGIVVLKREFVETSHGCLLTTSEAIKAVIVKKKLMTKIDY